jgi:hypothetical protein
MAICTKCGREIEDSEALRRMAFTFGRWYVRRGAVTYCQSCWSSVNRQTWFHTAVFVGVVAMLVFAIRLLM